MPIEQTLQLSYGLKGELTRLDGDLDTTFLFSGEFGKYIFKLMHTRSDVSLTNMQVKALQHLGTKELPFDIPHIVPTLAGKPSVVVEIGKQAHVGWLISFMDGRLMSAFKPFSPPQAKTIGGAIAALNIALRDFSHPGLKRNSHWDLQKAGWVKEKLHLHQSPNICTLIRAVCEKYDNIFNDLEKCATCAIHGNINDMNVFVSEGSSQTRINGIIDFDDLIASKRIFEVATAAAYAAMDSHDPLANAAALLAEYHSSIPLEPVEIETFFPLMLMRLAATYTSSLERQLTEPGVTYLTHYQEPALRLLERFHGINMDLVIAYFREACGLAASATSNAVTLYLASKRGTFPFIFNGLNVQTAYTLDLSVGAPITVSSPVSTDTHALNAEISDAINKSGKAIAIGGYGEERPIYTGKAFGGSSAAPRVPPRTHHIGVDITVPAGTVLYAPLAGTIWTVGNAAEQFDYGGYIVLKHQIPSGEYFYSLYGHLAPSSLKDFGVGDRVDAGSRLAKIGAYEENGGWWPHLHLQLMTEQPATEGTPPGACEGILFPSARSLYPNPAAILNLPDTATC